MTFLQWLNDYYENRQQTYNSKGFLQGERLGQAFVNDFIKEPWPSLYYSEEDGPVISVITTWLMDHQYYVEMPEKIK